ncbi:MAG TPA: hypothetical protein VMR25_15060 [Planctomycetaceae bacterium]|nr:hypothetical protein [Planctomycetaceae bacterium]
MRGIAIVNGEMNATFCEALLLEGEHLFPILLHVHNHPATFGRLGQRLDKLAAAFGMRIVGVFADGIGMVDD